MSGFLYVARGRIRFSSYRFFQSWWYPANSCHFPLVAEVQGADEGSMRRFSKLPWSYIGIVENKKETTPI